MNDFKLKNLLILSLLFVGCESSTYGPKWSSAIDNIANEAMNTGKVAGISVGVAYGDSEFFKGYGKADLELDVATPDNAIYEIGSVTKQFTAAGILKLAEEGKIDLNADIRKYLGSDAEFPDKKGMAWMNVACGEAVFRARAIKKPCFQTQSVKIWAPRRRQKKCQRNVFLY